VSSGAIDVRYRERYVHRRSITGEELNYVSLVSRKTGTAEIRA